jgi:biopolymer transport protein TolQ
MLELIFGASLVVQLVLLVLVLASVASWAVILYKSRELRAAERDTDVFLEAYMERPLDAVFDVARQHDASPLAALFSTGYRELAQMEKMQGSREEISTHQLEAVLQRLVWVQTSERHRLERGLSFLATTGSSAPFVGLFGTVVGIMNAFRDIGASGTASLAVVAPGIAEALVATGVGLFAAIPAVIGYNYQGARLNRLLDRLDDFRVEYADSLRRALARLA